MRRWPWWSWRARSAGDESRTPATSWSVAGPAPAAFAAAARLQCGRPAAAPPERIRNAAPSIQIRCFGGFAVQYAGRTLRSRERALEWQLLAYLAVHPADGVARDELVQAVWGRAVPLDSSRVNAALCRLRRLLKDQVPTLCSMVVTSHRDGRVSLDSAAIQCDAQEAWRLLATVTRLPPADWQAVLARVGTLAAAPLLEGCRWPGLQQRDAYGRTLGERLVRRLDALAHLSDDFAPIPLLRWRA
jgi:hypothetical protein